MGRSDINCNIYSSEQEKGHNLTKYGLSNSKTVCFALPSTTLDPQKLHEMVYDLNITVYEHLVLK